MRANPNEGFARNNPEFIPPRSHLTLIAPPVNGPHDQEQFNHELGTVLGHLLHHDPTLESWSVSHDEAYPHNRVYFHTVALWAVGLVQFHEALRNLAERYGLPEILYSYGPLGGVTNHEHHEHEARA